MDLTIEEKKSVPFGEIIIKNLFLRIFLIRTNKTYF